MGLWNRLFGKSAAKRKLQAWNLGRDVDYRQIPRLQPYLKDEDVEVRRAAASSHEQQWPTGDAIGLMALAEALGDPDAVVRKTAALAIGEFVPCAKTSFATKMASEAVGGLLRLIETEQDEAVLDNAFIALANIDDSASVQKVAEAVRRSNHPAVAAVALKAIGCLRQTEARRRMIAGIECLTDIDKQSGTNQSSRPDAPMTRREEERHG